MGAEAIKTGEGDIAALAKGGRTNFFGFLLRLAARLPFLFIAGRWYGDAALGRFAYAVLVVEFAAQISTLGLKRGLALQLTRTEGDRHGHAVWDAMVVTFIISAVTGAILALVPRMMFPNSEIDGLDRLLPLIIFFIAGADIALAALAYRRDVGATVRARAIVEPWTISIGAFAFAFYSTRDGLILAYVLSMVAAFVTAMIPLARSYGWPRGWTPHPGRLWGLAQRNAPLAAADAVEWGSRRIDIAILGLFFSPAIVGIYYVAQQVASLPQKLKTSFDPILGPVITAKLAEGDKAAVAKQVRQVGFWIIAAQAGIGLALGIPGEGVMGLVGPNFVGGTGALAFLLAAEVVAATAVVSEAALIYIARHRNLMISLAMIAVQALLSFVLIFALHSFADDGAALRDDKIAAAGPAVALALALAGASIVKAGLLSRLLGAPVSGWRWPIVWASAAAVVVGETATRLPEWAELALGIPATLAVYCAVIWKRGFTEEDRVLFKRAPADPARSGAEAPPLRPLSAGSDASR